MEFDKKVIVDVDGFIEKGKQFDLDLRLPEDDRNVVYGVIKDHHGEPIKDAVVKLVEVCKDERKPVSHSFTDKEGEFVFGPLCPHKSYAIQIWVNQVKHVKICKVCEHDGRCLKGVDLCCEREPRRDYRDDYREYEKDDRKYENYKKYEKDDEKYEDYRKYEKDDERYEDYRKCDKKDEKHEDYKKCDKKDDKYDEYDKRDKKDDKYDEYDKCDKKDNKYDEYDKCDKKDNKYDDFDKCDKKDEKYDEYDKCDKKDEKHDDYDKCDKKDNYKGFEKKGKYDDYKY